jgi:hypothetical protein
VVGVVRNEQQRLLDEPADETGIGAAARDGGGARRAGGVGAALLVAHELTERVVGAVGVGTRRVKVKAGPRLDDSVDVERAELAAESHERERARVDRQIDDKRRFRLFSRERVRIAL